MSLADELVEDLQSWADDFHCHPDIHRNQEEQLKVAESFYAAVKRLELLEWSAGADRVLIEKAEGRIQELESQVRKLEHRIENYRAAVSTILKHI